MSTDENTTHDAEAVPVAAPEDDGRSAGVSAGVAGNVDRLFPLSGNSRRDQELQRLRGVALATAFGVENGDITLRDVAEYLATARKQRDTTMAQVKGAAIAGAALGIAETTLSEELGVSRLTIRAALGKSS